MGTRELVLQKDCNYIGIFLTLGCQLKCSYCINIQLYERPTLHQMLKPMSIHDWIEGLNRIPARLDLPITLQGGEPTTHFGFYEIVKAVDKPMDLLTNAQFNIDEFIKEVPTSKFKRNAPYASIRVSYHPEQMALADTVNRVSTLKEAGYQVGVWMVEVPDQMGKLEEARSAFMDKGIDFRTKELMGDYKGHVYGTYKYPGAVGSEATRNVLCRTTELLVAPNGDIFRCHSDLYNLRRAVGNLIDPSFHSAPSDFARCPFYGTCVGCDIKVTNNRFQEGGWTSVEIKELTPANAHVVIA